MKQFKYLLIAIIPAFIFLFAGGSSAQEYPVGDLGNCRDQKECHLYCEIPTHKAACWSYNVYGAGQVLGDESPEEKLAPLGITFPIPELGNCANLSACKAYCSDTTNRAACLAYGEAHGLTKKEAVIERAQTELGCATREECSAFCALETNQIACQEFAKKYHLKGIVKNHVIEKAKVELGCTTAEKCRAMCEEPGNQASCKAFGDKFNLGESRKEQLVERAKTELGCTSFEDCRAFCQDTANGDKCSSFGHAVRQGVKFKVESLDCSTAEECRIACETHPDQCPNFPRPVENRIRNSSPGDVRNRIETGVKNRFQNTIENKVENRIEDRRENFETNSTEIIVTP